ncbi:M91 family zinc metallopeptidase [Treponema pedis]|uniref:M91 family zinc metallopeptidase n=1 Tax=Treponema pedis TaxID=409322 RepID=UPI003D1AC3C9
MKTKLYFYSQPNYLTFRTAIEAVYAVRQSRTSRQILFAVCISKKQALTGGKSLACEDKYSKKIEAVSVQQAYRRSFEASAVPILVYFYILCNNKSYKKGSGFLMARCLHQSLSSSFENKNITVTIKDFDMENRTAKCVCTGTVEQFEHGEPLNSTVYIDPTMIFNFDFATGDIFQPVTTLAHEMTHAYDNMQGNYFLNSEVPSDGIRNSYNKILEKRAIDIENQVRLTFGYKHRNTYSGIDVGARSEEQTKRRMEMWRRIK